MNTLKDYKERNNLSYKDLETQTGIPREYLAKLANGARRFGGLGLYRAYRLSKMLGCTLKELEFEDHKAER